MKQQRGKEAANCPGHQVTQIRVSVFLTVTEEAELPGYSNSYYPPIVPYWPLAGL